jgi:hypothetical protein
MLSPAEMVDRAGDRGGVFGRHKGTAILGVGTEDMLALYSAT